jgi:hypothetical protein
MKNCGEYVHFEVVEQHILQEMVKIVQKKVYPHLPLPTPLLTIIMFLNFFKTSRNMFKTSTISSLQMGVWNFIFCLLA